MSIGGHHTGSTGPMVVVGVAIIIGIGLGLLAGEQSAICTGGFAAAVVVLLAAIVWGRRILRRRAIRSIGDGVEDIDPEVIRAARAIARRLADQ